MYGHLIHFVAPYIVPSLRNEKAASNSGKSASLLLVLPPTFEVLEVAGALEALVELGHTHHFQIMSLSTQDQVARGGDPLSLFQERRDVVSVKSDLQWDAKSSPQKYQVAIIPSSHPSSKPLVAEFLKKFLGEEEETIANLVLCGDICAAILKDLGKSMSPYNSRGVCKGTSLNGTVRIYLGNAGMCAVSAALDFFWSIWERKV